MMLELLLGMALGGLAFTEKGHEIGNKIGGMALDAAKKVMSNEKPGQPLKEAKERYDKSDGKE